MSSKHASTDGSARAVQLDRREFLGATGAVALTVTLPLPAIGAGAAEAGVEPRALLSDWTIDDMWGVYPRYAEPIDHVRPRTELVAAVDPVDELFVVA